MSENFESRDSSMTILMIGLMAGLMVAVFMLSALAGMIMDVDIIGNGIFQALLFVGVPAVAVFHLIR